MVNPLRRVYNKTPWQQRRLSQPLSDPNYIVTPLQQSTIYEHDDDQQQHAQEQQQLQLATQPLQRQVTIAPLPNSNNNNSGAPSGEPIRRGMTRADTKISLRKTKKDSRRVFVNIPLPPQYLDKNGSPKLSFGSNRINTAKYTTLTFLPKNLFEQFRRVANMFFLFMAIIQLTPLFTVGSPFLTVFPLCFVVGVTAIKDGFEDYKRHVEDRNFNQRLCQQLKNVVNYNYPTADHMAARKGKSLPARAWTGLTHGVSTGTKKVMRALKLAEKPTGELPQMDLNELAAADMDVASVLDEQNSQQQQQQQNNDPNASTAPQPEFCKEQWHHLRVGDFILLKNNQAVPADAIILSTSEAEGSCFIETKDLDGETNLKTRMSLHETSKYNTARRCSRLKFYIDMEPINANLFTFNGSLTMLAKKRRPGNATGHASGPSGNNRLSHYAPSITSSMMSSVRGSMDENEAYRETLEHGEESMAPADGASDGPAQSGTSASDYARLHKSPSQRRRSRLSGSHGDHASSGLPTSPTGDKQEYEEPSENYQDGQHPGAESLSPRLTSSKRSSLHRNATQASMAGASEMAKNVLKAKYEQQFQQDQNASHARKDLPSIPGSGSGQADNDTSKNNCPYKETTIPVDINNMLLRGHVIRNTHWVIAVIVATGTETKIMLNSGETPSKRSRIEKTMNVQVAINFGILLLLCVVCAIGSTIYDRKWRGTGAEQLWDQSLRGVTIEGVITFFTSLIIFQNIIPISLYISIEFVKTFQAYFIWQDSDMYDIELDQFCTPKTWNLTDDLGQIEYVFSDKTGTLTRNIMEFKKCTINGKIYGNNAVAGQTDAEKGLELMGGQDSRPEHGGEAGGQQEQQPQQGSGGKHDKEAVLKEYDQEIRKLFEPTYLDPLEILTFADPDILRDLSSQGGENRSTITAVSSNGEGSSTSPHQGSAGPQHDGSPSSNIRDFFTLLALCHTVVIEQPEEDLQDDENDEFGLYADNGSPTDKDSVDENDGRFVDANQEQPKPLGIRDKLKQKAEAAGLSVPGTETKPTTRSRKNSNAGSIASNVNGLTEEKPKPTIKYRAESPDEAALVSAAKNVGFAFVSRGASAAPGGQAGASGGNSRQNVNLNILGQDHTYEQLDVIKFNSTRKRMTVIVREPQELGGKILLLTKGADNVIFERLTHDDDETLRDQTESDIEAFSNMGLRTLTLAQRVLDQETYDQWAVKYAEAGKALDDRAKKMDQVAEEIEKDLTLLGATAIEDKLQEGVPESIAALREAGIKVWVLTGDKLETAINIGFASRLLEKDMKLEIMKMGRNEDPTQVLKRFKELVDGVLSGKGGQQEETGSDYFAETSNKANQSEAPLNEKAEYSEKEHAPTQPYSTAAGNTWDEKGLPPTPAGTSLVNHEHEQQQQQSSGQGQHALIVDGSALKILLDDPQARQDLIKLSDVCFSVICCRASPLQKALVVELIRRGKKTVCLAIGDGANDVSMIQAANIGVGIAGQEGMQAAMASDYSISQFRFIRKLVLVHGHWGYMRISEMILNFFFKNVLWVAAVLWFQIYCGFSAMLFYDYTFVSLYNLMLTAVPVLVLGATDQDLTSPYILRYPGVYKLGIQQKRYNQTRFIIYMLDGVWQSLVVFWFWRGVFGLNVLGTKGFDNSLLEFSTSVAITNVVIASLYVGLHTYHWTWLMHFAVWGSIIFLVLLIVLYGFVQSSPIYHVAIHLFTYGPFWFMLFLSVVTAFLARFTALFVSFWWFPDDVHVVRRIMLSEKWNAETLKMVWTGLAPDGLTPAEQTEQEKALLRKQDCINAEKEAAKLAKKNAKDPNFNDNNNDQHPNSNQPGSNTRAGTNQEQPYDLTMFQITVDDHSQDHNQQSAQPRSVPAQTPLQIQQQLLMAQQQQHDRLVAEATANGSADSLPLPNDPEFQHNRRTSSYNYNSLNLDTLKDKPAALPPIPSPSLPSLPSYTAGSSSAGSLHQATIARHGPPPRIVATEEAIAAGQAGEREGMLGSDSNSSRLHQKRSDLSLNSPHQPPSPSPLSAEAYPTAAVLKDQESPVSSLKGPENEHSPLRQ